jgi:hypothetical protein
MRNFYILLQDERDDIWPYTISFGPRKNRQKVRFLNKKKFSDLNFFCTFGAIKKPKKIWAYHIFRKYPLKTIYSGTNFSSFLDFRLILSITAQSIFAVKRSACARWKGISIDKNKKNNNNNNFLFYLG